jgi:hypothetical protein
MIDPESYWFAQSDLAKAAMLSRADSIVCYVNRRFTVLPEHCRATCVMGGFYNVACDACLYTLPCPELSDWLWNPNEAYRFLSAQAPQPQPRSTPSTRLLERLRFCTNGAASPQFRDTHFFKVVVSNWLIVIFAYCGPLRLTRANGQAAPIECSQAAFDLARALFERMGVFNKRSHRRSEKRRQAKAIVASLQPESTSNFSNVFVEYLDALASQTARFLWPTAPLDVTASVHLVVPATRVPEPEPASDKSVESLRDLVELPIYEQLRIDRMRDFPTPSQNPSAVQRDRPDHRGPLCLHLAQHTGRFSREGLMHNQIDSHLGGDFTPGKRTADGSKPSLVRHSACLGEAYILADYEINHTRARRYSPSLAFLSDLNRFISQALDPLSKATPGSTSPAKSVGATNVILPLVDDDGDHCMGAMSIEGILTAGTIDLTTLYLAQYIVHCATEQIRALRIAYFRDRIAGISKDVLVGDVDETTLKDNEDEACNLIESLIDNTTRAEFIELKKEEFITGGRHHALTPITRTKEYFRQRKNALRGSGPSGKVAGSPSDVEAWLGYPCTRGSVPDSTKPYLCQHGPLLPFSFRGLSSETTNKDRTVLYCPLFAEYPKTLRRESVRQPAGKTKQEEKQTVLLTWRDHYALGILKLSGVQPWPTVLNRSGLGPIFSDLRKLVELLKRVRYQALEPAKITSHELKHDRETALDVLDRLQSRHGGVDPCDELRDIALKGSRLALLTKARGFMTPRIGKLLNNETAIDVLRDVWDRWTHLHSTRDVNAFKASVYPKNWRKDWSVNGRFAALVACANWHRNGENSTVSMPESQSKDRRLVIMNKLAESDKTRRMAQLDIDWYPQGKPGRGRFIARSALLGIFDDLRVYEKIEEKSNTWTTTVALLGETSTGDL